MAIRPAAALGEGLPTPPISRPKVSLQLLETFGQRRGAVGRPHHSERRLPHHDAARIVAARRASPYSNAS